MSCRNEDGLTGTHKAPAYCAECYSDIAEGRDIWKRAVMTALDPNRPEWLEDVKGVYIAELEAEVARVRQREEDERALADKALASLDRMQERAEQAEDELNGKRGYRWKVEQLEQRVSDFRVELKQSRTQLQQAETALERIAESDCDTLKPSHHEIARAALDEQKENA